MKKLLSVAFFAGLSVAMASAQDESFRFFFDTVGNDGTAQGARSAANLSFTNPNIAGSGRLFLYLQYGTANQDFSGNNMRIDITGGPATLTGGSMYNHKSTTNLDRWGTIPNSTVTAGVTSWEFGSVFKVGAAGFGAKNVASNGTGAPDVEDNHFDRTDGGNGFGTTLLGFVDVNSNGGNSNVFMQNGDSGSGGVTITSNDYVYFGFGDNAYLNKKGAAHGGAGGDTLRTADATITPEPISLALLGLGALILRRRR